MDPTPDGTPEDVRIAAIRRDIEMARVRIVKTIDALEYKADMSARLADVLSSTAASFTSRFLKRIPSRVSSAPSDPGDPDQPSLLDDP
jgi:hypothetical protein